LSGHRIELLPSQDRFLFSDARYPAFVAGIGSGKTVAGALRSYQFAQKGDGMVVAPTFPMLRDATQHTFFELLDKAGIGYEFHKADQEARVFGHRVLFRTAEHPDRLRGPNMNWAWLDEAAMMRPATWDIVLGRLRMGSPSAWVTTTPAGFNWVHDKWTSDDEKYQLINASTADNTHLPDEYLADLEASYSGEFAQQELHGQFVAFEGLVYSEFRRGVHTFTGEVPAGDECRAIDFGYTNPFVCIFGRVDNDGRLWIYDEYYQRRELIEHHAEQIKAKGEYEWAVADHDAQDAAQLRHNGVMTFPAKKDVLLGISKVKSRLIVQGDGKPRLFIHERCINLLKELGMYRWKENTTKEEPVKENDHTMDALRYMVMRLEVGEPKVMIL
jgi:PBSX family phage terminase large subunit